MKKILTMAWMIIFILITISGCNSQNDESSGQKVDRKAVVDGKFYPADPEVLRNTLKDLFSKAKPRMTENVVALVCPHAGYDFSGVVAASSYNQIDREKKFENIFIIGSSHYVSFSGASIYTAGDYLTPLGKVKVNTTLARNLIKENPVFVYYPDADRQEHSIEVQVPFLQYHLKNEFQLVPIVVGSQNEEACRKIAKALKPYMNDKNLFIFSSDFSHYPSYNEAVVTDKKICDAIVSNNPETLMNTIRDCEKKGSESLVTSLCGWTSVLTMINMTAGDPGLHITPFYYQNSGDSKYNDKSRVVGYWSIAVTGKGKESAGDLGFHFTTTEKIELLRIARSTIVLRLTGKNPEVPDPGKITEGMKIKAGAFVTLNKKGELRGCIGRFTSEEPLYKLIQEMAIAAATEDPRFEPVSSNEIKDLEIEISVLSPMKKIRSADEIILGKHGIYIRKGNVSGTFLPQVATETGWTKEEFLGHCSRDKAGIGWDGWKTADLYIYEATVFSEKEVSGHKN